MTQKPAYFVAFYGMPCCLADSVFGPVELPTRRDLSEFVDSVLASVDFSKRSRRQINLADLWKRYQTATKPRFGYYTFVI